MRINFSEFDLVAGTNICDECLCRKNDEYIAEQEAQIRDAGRYWCNCCSEYIDAEYSEFEPIDFNEVPFCNLCIENV